MMITIDTRIMTSDALVRLPSCSQLVAEVEALTGISLSIDPALLVCSNHVPPFCHS